jgi:hypothetical protein
VASKKTPAPEIPRQEKGRFGKGNPGGKLKKRHLQLAKSCRDLMDEFHVPTARAILTNKKESGKTKLAVLQFLAERGYGKSPQVIKTEGIEPGSPEAILLELTEQYIPGSDAEEWGGEEPEYGDFAEDEDA